LYKSWRIIFKFENSKIKNTNFLILIEDTIPKIL